MLHIFYSFVGLPSARSIIIEGVRARTA